MSFSNSIESSPLAWMLPFKLNEDDREPVFVVWAPGTFLGLYIPSVAFWLQVFISVSLQSILSALISIVTYTQIIQKPGSSRYLLGYGVLIPLWIIVPRWQLHLFGVENMVINFCLSGIIPTLNIFHTMEAMYNCVPAYAAQSLSDYILYSGSPMILIYDNKSQKYVKSTWKCIIRHLSNFGLFLIVTGLLKSLLTLFEYQPFYQATTQWYDASRIFHLGQLGNNMLHGLLFQMYIVVFCEGMLAATAIFFGKQAEIVMENPLLKSTSPSEFWGSRWNKLIQGVLKRGVYIPARKANLPRAVAVLATFLASSLFHEWILTNLFYKVEKHEYIPDLGGSSAFLMWNGILLILETLLWKLSLFQWMKQNLPKPVQTLFVTMLAIPLAHCFCDAYVHSDFFIHGQVAFPMIKIVDIESS